MNTKAEKWLVVRFIVGALLIASIWPVRYLAAPLWSVSVVNDDLRPMSAMNVRLIYQNYSVENSSHEITLITDRNGRVQFPAQYGRASLLNLLYYSGLSATAGVHASFGWHAGVFVFGDGYSGDAVNGLYIADWRGAPGFIHSTIVARKRSH